MSASINKIIVDWGTTNFRAFAVDDTGAILCEREKNMGLLQVEDGQFSQSLEALLIAWFSDLGDTYRYKALPVFMAGMVGSLKGWVNVPYAKTQAGLGEISAGAHRFTLPWGAEACIYPGVSHSVEAGVNEVMRGEEVQLIGLSALNQKDHFHAMLPGTHNKHAVFGDGKISAFSSFLTGEMFSVMSKHMLLGKGLDAAQLGQHEEAFLRGVKDGVETTQLGNTLFRSWTHRLFNQLDESEVLDYLSGMLIGNELQDLSASHYYLIGGSGLTERYHLALKSLDVNASVVSGNDCFVAGMAALADSSV